MSDERWMPSYEEIRAALDADIRLVEIDQFEERAEPNVEALIRRAAREAARLRAIEELEKATELSVYENFISKEYVRLRLAALRAEKEGEKG